MNIEPEDHLVRENGKLLTFIDDFDLRQNFWLYGEFYDRWPSLHFSSRRLGR